MRKKQEQFHFIENTFMYVLLSDKNVTQKVGVSPEPNPFLFNLPSDVKIQLKLDRKLTCSYLIID